jgi:hypothetical protein
VLVLLALAFVLAFLGAWQCGNRTAGTDFYQFWAAGRAVRTMEVGNVYAEEERIRIGAEFLRRAEAKDGAQREKDVAKYRKVLPTYHSPLMYTVFGRLLTSDYETDFARYRHACLLLAVGSCLLLLRLLRYPRLPALAFLVVFLTWFEPLRSDLRVGNVGQLQFAMLALFLWNQSRRRSTARDLRGGAILGFALIFKPSIVILVGTLGLSWLLARDFRKVRDQCLGMALGAGVGLGAAGAYFGSMQVWIDFLGILPLPEEIIPFSEGNYAPDAQFFAVTGVHVAPLLALLLLPITGGVIWRGMERLKGSLPEDLAAAALGCQFMLLASPVAWVHYHLLCIPAFLIALRAPRGGRRATARQTLAAAALLPLAETPLSARIWGEQPHALAIAVTAGMLALFALVAWELQPDAPRTGAQDGGS